LLTGSHKRPPLRSIAPLALAAALGASVLAGCGGSSSASIQTTTVTQGASATTATATNAAATTAAGSSAHGGHSAHGSVNGAGSSASGSGHAAKSSAANASTGIPFPIHTTSMTPTYQPYTTVYYDPTATHPRVGQVVVFHPPAGIKGGVCGGKETGNPCQEPVPGLAKGISIKRVVGLPGDTIAIHDGRVIRDGHPEPEGFTIPCGEKPGCIFTKAIVVPAGDYYLMSDYRELFQEDSRTFGAVPQEAILGTVEGS